MTTTTNLELTLVETAQAQKEVTVNAALSRIDAILNTGAKDKDLNTPPGSPATGDVYIVHTSPTGAWAGKAKQVAYYDQAWKFIDPNEGMTLWVNDEDKLYTYNGSSWTASSGASGIGKKLLYIPASQITPASVSGCSALTMITTTSGRPDISALLFDPTAVEYARFSLRMPKSWNEGDLTAIVEWSHPSAATNFGVVWGIQGVAVGDGETIDVVYGTPRDVADTGGNTNYLYKTNEITAITIGGSLQENDTVYFQVYRSATHGSDTLTVDARLHGVALFYTTNAATDD